MSVDINIIVGDWTGDVKGRGMGRWGKGSILFHPRKSPSDCNKTDRGIRQR